MMYKSPTGAPAFYMSPKEKQNLDIMLNGVLNYKQDGIIIIDGEEGSGKSRKSRQYALYCADVCGTSFDRDGVENIHSSMEKHVKIAEQRAKEKVVGFVNVLDEARAVLGKSGHMTRPVRTYINWLSECRDMGQIHIIVLPRFHDLHKYIVLNRMHFLVHMYKEFESNPNALGGYDFKLGAFKMYAADAALIKAYSEPYSYPSIWAAHDRTRDIEVLTPAGVEALSIQKQAERAKRFEDEQAREKITKDTMRTNILLAVMNAEGRSPKTLAKLINMSDAGVKLRINAGKETPMYKRLMGLEEPNE